MKLVEALKSMKILDKRITKMQNQLLSYSSKLNTELPVFASDEEQMNEVQQLKQSILSLIQEMSKRRQQIDYTNMMTIVEINGKQYTISELIYFKKLCIDRIRLTYKALSEDTANRRLIALSRGTDVKDVKVIRMYDEKIKNEELTAIDEMFDQIDGKLEIINAMTDLMELPTKSELNVNESVSNPSSDNNNDGFVL